MCTENINFYVMTMELKKLETHEQIVGNSWAILSIISPRFYGVIIVLYGDAVNSFFQIPLIIFVNYLSRDSCYGLDFIKTGTN